MLEKIKNFFRSFVFVPSKPEVEAKQEPAIKKEPEVVVIKNVKVEPAPTKPKTVKKTTRKPKQNGTVKKQSK